VASLVDSRTVHYCTVPHWPVRDESVTVSLTGYYFLHFRGQLYVIYMPEPYRLPQLTAWGRPLAERQVLPTHTTHAVVVHGGDPYGP
jgi:hypothetical protein